MLHATHPTCLVQIHGSQRTSHCSQGPDVTNVAGCSKRLYIQIGAGEGAPRKKISEKEFRICTFFVNKLYIVVNKIISSPNAKN